MSEDKIANLKDLDKKKLLAKLLKRKKKQETSLNTENGDVKIKAISAHTPTLKEGMNELKKSLALLKVFRQENPFFRVFDGMMKPTLTHKGKEIINYSGYDYLGYASDPRVHDASCEAIRNLGTSVSASRTASGERPLHGELEKELAALFGVDDALVFVGGYGTNEGVLGHIAGPKDIVIHDALMHRSAIEGVLLSGASRVQFPHNDLDALEEILADNRNKFRQCFILVEGLYSMDGDLPDLVRLIALKKKYKSFLFVDEAHSLGVLGKNGRGVGEHCEINPKDVDLWMGTLSKSFASCGGVVAGDAGLIKYLRYTPPAFVYSVGISPANAAAALCAIRLLLKEPERALKAQENGRYFFELLNENGLNTGLSAGYNVVPLVIGHTKNTVKLSNELLENGINTQAIFHPIVAENEARLRFFITAEHTKDQLEQSVATILRLYRKICQ